MSKYTVRWANSITGGQGFRGTFDSPEEAESYARRQAKQSRSFVEYEVWIGSAGKGVSPKGPRIKGEA